MTWFAGFAWCICLHLQGLLLQYLLQAIVVGEDDGEAPPAEGPPAKMLGGVDIGVDDEGVGEAPS